MKRSWAVLLAVAVVFSCGAVPRGKVVSTVSNGETSVIDYAGKEPAYYYTEGFKASFEGDTDKAMALYQQAINSDSTYGPAYYQMSELTMIKQPAEALGYIRKAVDSDTLNVTYLSQLGRALIMNGKYDEAQEIYSELMGKDPNNPVNYSMLAALYEFDNQPFTAISILDSAEVRLGRIEELAAYKRQLLINMRLYDKAIDETIALINDYPYDHSNYVILGDLYASMGRDSLAIHNYREAIRIDSTNIETIVSVAEFYKKRGNERNYLMMMRRLFESDYVDIEDKIAIFYELTISPEYYRNNYFAINSLAATLLVKYPDNYDVLDLYAGHLIRSGEIMAALDLYKSYLTKDADTIPPYYAILDIESYLQRSDSVAKYSDMAIKQFPNNHDLYMRKGYALSYMGRDNDAIKAYRKALQKAPTDSVRSVVMGVIGDAYHQKGEPKKSYAAYEKALQYSPDNSMVLNNYAYYLSEQGVRLGEALEMSIRANQLSPSNATYLDTQAWIYYKMGQYEEAKRLMLQAVSLDRSGSSVLLLHYGDILYELGDYFMAKIYWRRALEKGAEAEQVEERLKWPQK